MFYEGGALGPNARVNKTETQPCLYWDYLEKGRPVPPQHGEPTMHQGHFDGRISSSFSGPQPSTPLCAFSAGNLSVFGKPLPVPALSLRKKSIRAGEKSVSSWRWTNGEPRKQNSSNCQFASK